MYSYMPTMIPGLTLRRFPNTALQSAGAVTTNITNLESIPTCIDSNCSAPSSFLLTGVTILLFYRLFAINDVSVVLCAYVAHPQ